MKNKKFTAVLICSVAAVWGVIFWRVFAAVADEAPIQPSSQAKPAINVSLDGYRLLDTFTLALNYRDPFTGTPVAEESDPAVAEVSVANISESAVRIVPPPINWSFIKYNGYITNPQTRKIVSIVTINGKEEMLADGQSTGAVKLIRNYKDSIKVAYQGKTHFIALN